MLGDQLLQLFSADFFHAMIRMAIPLILAALGEIYLERSGIINIGIEGLMLFGAFFGVLGSAITGSATMGLVWAMASGVVAALIFGLSVITLRSNQIVAGAALNIIALGLTTFLPRIIFGIRPLPPQVSGFEAWPVPMLSEIPFIGYILFRQTAIVYLTYGLIVVMTFILFRTTWGLKIRAVGEHPLASDTVGIRVYLWRYICVIVNGVLCGLAGASLSLAQLNTFVDNMTAGRGFIALAAVILGRWNPIGATLAALGFGAANALQLRLQAFTVGVSSQLLLMIPYAFTLLAVIVLRGQAAAPAALAQPYVKEQ